VSVRRRLTRVVPAAAVALTLAGCGGGPSAEHYATYYGIKLENLPQRRVWNPNWVETAPRAMVFRVKRLEIGPHGWSARVAFENISKQTIELPTGGQASPVDFGLGVFVNALSPRLEDAGNYIVYAKKFVPPLPKELKPGERWEGEFSSPQPPRAQRYVRPVFGVYFWKKPIPAGMSPYFLWVTSHGVQAPPPQGAAAVTTTGPR
jgi:hypothetical protein